MRKIIISESEKKNILSLYGLLKESLKDELPSSGAIKKLEKKFNVTIEDSHINAEKQQEGVDYYEDNNGIDEKANEQLKKLLSGLFSQFKNAPKTTNTNCDNIPGCVSGYRGYSTQAEVFGSKIKNGNVSERQKVSALPGFSQHHTGKTFDILSVDNSFWNKNPDIKNWVEKNASKYGFKVSYLSKGVLREAEPWHIYYVGGEFSDDKIKKEKEVKIEKKVDDFYASDKENPTLEKKIEKRYEVVGCVPKNKYTESPTFDEVKSDSSVVIRIGHKGKPVEEIQKKLIDLGYSVGNCGVDGLFGPVTKRALEEYQQENGLEVSSAVNQETIKNLEKPNKEQKRNTTQYDENKISDDFNKLSDEDKIKFEKIISHGNVKIDGPYNAEQKRNIIILIDKMEKAGITNPYTQIGILSVIGKESNFIPQNEISYATTSNNRIRSIFGEVLYKYSDSELDELKKDDKKFFNVVYGNVIGNSGGNDGWVYRGRGFNQLTGIKNYEKYGNMIGMGNKLVENPDLVNDINIAAEIAIAFFTKGKSPSSISKFVDKTNSAKYFADLNAGGVSNSHREKAILKSKDFEVDTEGTT